MASSSRPCSDEELQKVRDDLRRLMGRKPIPKEMQPPNDGEQGSNEEEEVNKGSNGKGEKKKKLIRLPPEVADFSHQLQMHAFSRAKPDACPLRGELQGAVR